MKKMILVLFISFISMFVSIYADETDITQKELVELVNNIRSDYSLTNVSVNEKLNEAAQSHSEYMSVNDIYSHEEDKSNEKFFGTYYWDRIMNVEYKSILVSEIIVKDAKNYKEALVKILDSPIKRGELLNPKYNEIGLGKKGEYFTFILGDEKNIDKQVLYPMNETNDVNLSYDFEKDEINKLELLSNKEYGYPINLNINSKSEIKRIYDLKVSLINRNENKEITKKVVIQDEDEIYNRNIIIIPDEKLVNNMSYVVTISYKMDTLEKKGQFIMKKGLFITTIEKNKNDSYIMNEVSKNEYEDINNHWIKQYISKLEEKKISFPKRENEFAPNEKMTREEVAKMIVRALELEIEKKNISNFKDVDSKSEFYDYINTAYKYEIIKGYSNNEFKPKNTITREELIVVVMRIYNNILNKDNVNINFLTNIEFYDMENASNYAKKSIREAKLLKIVEGNGKNMFYPKSNVTRAEASIIVYRLLNYIR
ncbi:MAG: S-layer homology domain-containing protein [Clostridia bacterium]|nr:S-layer homology domain-containing protein [Clostridia bacterium]